MTTLNLITIRGCFKTVQTKQTNIIKSKAAVQKCRSYFWVTGSKLTLQAAAEGFEAAERRDLFLARLSLLRSRCSFKRVASSFWYSAASDLALAILFFFSAILARFLCNVKGVTSLWILGALLHFFPEHDNGISRVIRHWPLLIKNIMGDACTCKWNHTCTIWHKCMHIRHKWNYKCKQKCMSDWQDK